MNSLNSTGKRTPGEISLVDFEMMNDSACKYQINFRVLSTITWRLIFLCLRDKREYNYKATTLDNVQTEKSRDTKLIYMGKRIPDITFGLSVYETGDPEDEGVDERERKIRRSLQKTQLRENIWELDGLSLVTDPKWGQHTLLFPFAVYEAKRDRNSEVQVKLQLKLAFNTYLRMLDNLVRQPGKKEYQTSESRIFPLFGFTSSGSMWKMYIGYLPNCVQNDPDSAGDPLCDDDSVSYNLNLLIYPHSGTDRIFGL